MPASSLSQVSSGLKVFLLCELIFTSACVCGAVDTEAYDPVNEIELDRPTSLVAVDFIQGEKGDPLIIGCADGQREGFADHRRNPLIAGCLGQWDGAQSLRAKPTGKPCGDDGRPCEVPADVCASGWHVCGASGLASDLSDRTSWEACDEEAGPGKFVAGMSHGQTQELCPPPPEPDTIFPCLEKGFCAEPVCCGDACDFGRCRDAIWMGATRISRGKAEGCANLRSGNNGGVLCCRDDKVAALRENLEEDSVLDSGLKDSVLGGPSKDGPIVPE